MKRKATITWDFIGKMIIVLVVLVILLVIIAKLSGKSTELWEAIKSIFTF